jgi:hypothetical protein
MFVLKSSDKAGFLGPKLRALASLKWVAAYMITMRAAFAYQNGGGLLTSHRSTPVEF